ncbi:hypothetical protein glysoja_041855 [Glycine soja]|uniref:Uncharacterized protein n=1 Tax=Glycine soja TaxID=3848 RepID=A0A0B2P9N0_GLYSO|nr:hypothetical protein glysoja_041855 [Glycine soja]
MSSLLHPNKNKHVKLSNLCSNSHIMDHNHHNNNRVPRIHAFLSPTPPSPPMLSFIAALSITTLIFMCLYVLSPIVSVAILLALYITTLFLCRFMQDRRELRERTSFHAQTPQNNQRVVRVFNKLFWVVEEKRGGKRQQVKKLLGCVLCFGSQAMASSCSCPIASFSLVALPSTTSSRLQLLLLHETHLAIPANPFTVHNSVR